MTDEHKNERRIIAEEFNSKFPDIEALVAGETGLDIFPRGSNKGQVIDDFKGYDVHFFESFFSSFSQSFFEASLGSATSVRKQMSQNIGFTLLSPANVSKMKV